MKEIDILPKWYKGGKRQKVSLRSQCIALVGVVAIMIVWNFIAASSVSRAEAELVRNQSRQSRAKRTLKEFEHLQDKIDQLQKKAEILRQIDSRIDVASVLSELSFLVDRKVVLSKVDFKAEKFADSKSGNSYSSGVRIARSKSLKGKDTSLLGDVRFKAVIIGVAAETSDVGKLVRKLEDSPYFCSVSLSFSRNKEIKVDSKPKQENRAVSEFEINCYLANYRQQEARFAKK